MMLTTVSPLDVGRLFEEARLLADSGVNLIVKGFGNEPFFCFPEVFEIRRMSHTHLSGEFCCVDLSRPIVVALLVCEEDRFSLSFREGFLLLTDWCQLFQSDGANRFQIVDDLLDVPTAEREYVEDPSGAVDEVDTVELPVVFTDDGQGSAGSFGDQQSVFVEALDFGDTTRGTQFPFEAVNKLLGIQDERNHSLLRYFFLERGEWLIGLLGDTRENVFGIEVDVELGLIHSLCHIVPRPYNPLWSHRRPEMAETQWHLHQPATGGA